MTGRRHGSGNYVSATHGVTVTSYLMTLTLRLLTSYYFRRRSPAAAATAAAGYDEVDDVRK